MRDFTYQSLPWNIVFGAGSLKRLPDELRKLNRSRALVLCTPDQTADAHRVQALLGDACIDVFDQAAMHVPAATVAKARALADKLGVDCTVAIGGGSTTGLGKALALQADLDNIVIPTSYAGSEMTNIWGITEDGRKVTGRDMKVVPTLTLYDPELTLSLPPEFAAASGLNAMAQAAVNVTSELSGPFVVSMAQEAVRRLAMSLPRVLQSPDDLDARANALYGASLAGGALGTGTTGLHHRLCHIFGGTFNTPHAQTHTVLLPHSIAYNAKAAAAGTGLLAEALDVNDAAQGIYQLAKTLGAPSGLRDLGVKEGDLDQAADMAVESAINNPEPITRDRIRLLLENAYLGRAPEAV